MLAGDWKSSLLASMVPANQALRRRWQITPDNGCSPGASLGTRRG